MTFLDELQKNATPRARTANGAVALATTHSAVLDFFASAGAMRNNVAGAVKLFRAAFQEDRLLAVRTLFYLRDIRGGQGERELFRALFKELRKLAPETASALLRFVPEFGRWDDLFAIAGTHSDVANLIYSQLLKDEADARGGNSVSLLAKWAPSENASSKVAKQNARALAESFGWSAREYRNRIVALRKYIGLLEQQMSNREWDEVQYGKLPSQAARKHNKAFRRHDGTRYEAFLDAVLSGKSKMNAGTVATYEVLDVVRKGDNKTADAVWKSLPDYTNGVNALVVADTSGSMGSIGYNVGRTQPIDVSTSLALYFAERNTGPFHNYFLTFSERPELVQVRGNTLTDKLRNISTANWGMNTDIQAVFNLVLKSAKAAGATAEDVPKVIYIISDMQFDRSTRNSDLTAFQNAQEQFRQAGYELPHLVFWNVNASGDHAPAHKNDSKVTLVSGLSQSTFRYVFEGKTPMESMLDILNSERYSVITV